MQKDYKILPPEVETPKQAENYWHKVKPLQRMPVNSAICRPASGDTIPIDKLPNGELEIAGYALPQGDEGPVEMVEISTDEGKTWEPATIMFPSSEELTKPGAVEQYRWCWAIWKHKLSADKTRRIDKTTKIWSRATDRAGNVQKLEDIKWNYRGVGYNGFGEVKGLNVHHVDQLTRRTRDMKIAIGSKI
jgi:sulfite oxidase